MPHIPNALTDSAPTAAVLGQSLYVAFKDNDSDHIYLASTKNPADSASWRIVDVNGITASPKSPKDEPAQIRTSHGPALTSVGNALWLTFKGHNNPVIWQIALRELAAGAYELLRFGSLPHAETAQDPAVAGPTMDPISASGPLPNLPMVVYRGNQDDGVWIYRYVPGTDPGFHLAGSHTKVAPAAAYGKYESQESRYVAYVDGATQQVMFTRNYRPERPGLRPGWQQPMPVPYGFTSKRPALAVHDAFVFLACKSRDADDHQVAISSWDGTLWINHGNVPNVSTDQGPALVSFRNKLYVVFKELKSNRIGYVESDASRREVRPTIVVSLSGAAASTSWDFHKVVERCAATHGYPLALGVNWYQDKGDTVSGKDDTTRIKDAINRLAAKQGGDKHVLSALVLGKSAGGVLAWNTFKRNFISLMGDFHRVALVLVDAHGSAYEDDRTGPYCDHQDLWWPSNWPSDRSVFRVYNIRQREDTLTGADFPDRRVYSNILLSGGGIDHYNIIDRDRTHELITEALSFALSGE